VKIRLKANPHAYVTVTDAEYHDLVEQGLVIKPYDPDREASPWGPPSTWGTYIQAPDVHRDRFDFVPEDH
jgi:hypothetical protein